MDSCDGYGRSRKHGAFFLRAGYSCLWKVTAASCDASFVLPFTLHLKDENEKGDLDYEQEIFRTGRIISQRENG